MKLLFNAGCMCEHMQKAKVCAKQQMCISSSDMLEAVLDNLIVINSLNNKATQGN